ncbi:hypothetical protein B0T49_13605 [Chromobacterium violaceum]|nr:hypothetical protein B0T41_21110 [Chromobacterium violaceum]OQS46719.1 hypothetical protein B0T48_14815 [Chromobacterium violaceum]OQS49365.1 hypothetical protein B0T49_13605 [Chromobacterium violaceum]
MLTYLNTLIPSTGFNHPPPHAGSALQVVQHIQELFEIAPHILRMIQEVTDAQIALGLFSLLTFVHGQRADRHIDVSARLVSSQRSLRPTVMEGELLEARKRTAMLKHSQSWEPAIGGHIVHQQILFLILQQRVEMGRPDTCWRTSGQGFDRPRFIAFQNHVAQFQWMPALHNLHRKHRPFLLTTTLIQAHALPFHQQGGLISEGESRMDS